MLGDLIGELFGELVFGRLKASRRVQLLTRLFFGLLGAGLSAAGAYHILFQVETGNAAFRASGVGLFVFFGSVWLFNVALGRQWKWPAVMTGVALVSMFVTRIAGGP